MYKVQKKLFGQKVNANSKVFNTIEFALAEAVNLADEFARDHYKSSKAGKVSVYVSSGFGSDDELFTIYATHEDKVGAWEWFVIKV